MRIVQITPSSGDSFYCENCLRDITLVTAMRNMGHDVLMIPLYLPLPSGNTESINSSPIFFGGVNVYLQQKSDFFQKTPRWIDRLFDSPFLLRWAGRKAGMTNARDLGEATTSILTGEHGRQKKELDRLATWLTLQDNKPDIICLSNILLAGLAKNIKERLGVPVVCMLQDEDEFLDSLTSPYAQKAWRLLCERSGDVDIFIAVSKYYAGVMERRLQIPPGKIQVLHVGISLEGFEPRTIWPQIPTIGFLSRMCPDKGLDTLVDAFITLKKNEKLKNARLRIAGGKRADDEEFIKRIRQQLDSLGLIGDVEFLPSFDKASKLAFLQTLSVLSVPEKKSVAYGLYVLEALATGVPVVQPASGVFPELMEATGGGVLFEPNNVTSLVKALEQLLLDSDYTQTLGEKGRRAVFEKFNIEQTAEKIVRIYQKIT
ncbi:MAG: glycosyltransferase family 4 protein [Sedimentisphaerales bacterium]|jgi:glycosyltransferase involved in cell wall biosynthesis|nr:glycosyltransferase family 4 protein [Sedimentisphaerales bacterium]